MCDDAFTYYATGSSLVAARACLRPRLIGLGSHVRATRGRNVVVDGNNCLALGSSVVFALTNAIVTVILLSESTYFLCGSGPL